MMRYSMNINREQIALAQGKDVDASYKDLAIVCDAIRYLRIDRAMGVLDGVISMQQPILFRKFNKHMGARHELGGRKGAYPVKAAKEVKKILVNATANSKNMGMDEEGLYVVHASANKTQIQRRGPSKGGISWGRGMYGMSARVHSDLEYAKIEIGISNSYSDALTEKMRYLMKVRNPVKETKTKPTAKPKEKAAAKPQAAITRK